MDERCPVDEGMSDDATPHVARRGQSAEEDAFRRLLILDLPGARASFETLVGDVLGVSKDHRDASYLLHDVLSRVERVVAEHQGLPPRRMAERSAAAQRFAMLRSREELSWLFWSGYEAATSLLGVMSPPGHPAIESVKAYVRENYKRKISLTEISLAVGVSRNYLSHLFRRQCRVTVTEFIQRTRMKEAERLLLTGTRTVSEIAYLVGYQNYRDFHRNFVKYQKTSPKQFRQVRGAGRRPLAVLPP